MFLKQKTLLHLMFLKQKTLLHFLLEHSMLVLPNSPCHYIDQS
uniref:Uncharacterized protein n=1 Tax=Arundo donax TaxID=35708 RepID=A0A0A9DY82_ARUDO